MLELTPRITINGRDVDYLDAGLSHQGNLKAAQLDFTLPTATSVGMNFWNKEVTFYMNTSDAVPLFRGWIKRVKEDYNKIQKDAKNNGRTVPKQVWLGCLQKYIERIQ